MQETPFLGLEKERIHFLILEPSENLRFMLEAMLSPIKSKITWAGTVSEALQLSISEHPDLIVSDHSLETDGVNLCQSVRVTQGIQDTPFILMPSFSRHINRITYFESGCDQIVYKPFRCKDIYWGIKRSLESRKLRGPMKIHVLYKSGETEYVDQISLNKLINSKEILCFRRKGGVAVLGRDPIRSGKSVQYEGPERRMAAA